MKDFIKATLVKEFKTISTDRYGQVKPFDLRPSIFGERAGEVEAYCKENKGILQFSTYGGRVGEYRAFSIEDKDIQNACQLSLSENLDRIERMNNW
jgi:hypothetical protein